MPVSGRSSEPQTDHRKAYPMGTRGSVEIDAFTDEPQTKRRGREFAEIVRDVMVEAHATLEQRLAERGYKATVKIVGGDLGAWWPADITDFDRDEAWPTNEGDA